MSGEFREISGAFLHSALQYIEEGSEPLSKHLARVYRAVHPLERACAWVEAGDCESAECLVAAAENAEEVTRACSALIDYVTVQKRVAMRLLINEQRKNKT